MPSAFSTAMEYLLPAIFLSLLLLVAGCGNKTETTPSTPTGQATAPTAGETTGGGQSTADEPAPSQGSNSATDDIVTLKDGCVTKDITVKNGESFMIKNEDSTDNGFTVKDMSGKGKISFLLTQGESREASTDKLVAGETYIISNPLNGACAAELSVVS